MKKLSLNDFAKAYVTIERKGMMAVNGKGGIFDAVGTNPLVETFTKLKKVDFKEAY